MMNFMNQQLGLTPLLNGTRGPAHRAAGLPSSSMEQLEMLENCPDLEANNHQKPWNMQMAFNATSGACVYRGKHTKSKKMTTLSSETLGFLATTEPETLTPIETAASQHPGPSTVIVKALTCIQAAWFCSQCVARMSSGMAISLVELNTFAHCISALFIYGFWWHKPYDVTSYVFMQSDTLDFLFLVHQAVEASQRSKHPRHNRGDATVRLYVHDGPGSRVRLAEFDLEEVSSTRRENSDSIRITEREFIAETKFYFRTVAEAMGSRDTEGRSFLLPKHSLSHWQRLWRFSVDTPFAITSAHKNLAQAHFATRSKNIEGSWIDVTLVSLLPADERAWSQWLTVASMNVAFILYGGLHLLAWQYHFRSTAETILWKTAGIFTASSRAVALLLALNMITISLPDQTQHNLLNDGINWMCLIIILVWIPTNIAARAFLFVESFVALPNSPPSTYRIPLWTAYIPHI